MSTLAVVEEILRETGVPMSVRQIVEYAGSRLPTRSKTPDTVVARDLSMNIKRRGEESLFVRSSPGRYTLRELHVASPDGAVDGVENAPSGLEPTAELVSQPTQATQPTMTASHSAPPADADESIAVSAALAAPDCASAAGSELATAAPVSDATPVLASALRAERSGAIPSRKPNAQDGQHTAGTH